MLAAGLANNLVLDQALGVSAVTAMSRKFEVAVGMATVSSAVFAVAGISAYLLELGFLQPFGFQALRLLVFMLFVAVGVRMADEILRWRWPAAWHRHRVFLPLAALNSGVLGCMLITIETAGGPVEALATALGLAGGFAMTLIALAAIRERLAVSDVPAPFRGVPISLIVLGFMAMAISGFRA